MSFLKSVGEETEWEREQNDVVRAREAVRLADLRASCRSLASYGLTMADLERRYPPNIHTDDNSVHQNVVNGEHAGRVILKTRKAPDIHDWHFL